MATDISELDAKLIKKEVYGHTVRGSYFVEQLLSVIIESFMRKHAFVTVDTVPCGVEQLTGEFT